MGGITLSQKSNSELTEVMSLFHQKSHFWGRLTLGIVILLSILLPLYLSFVLDLHPGWSVIIAGIIGYASFVGVMWIIEPVTYFPVLGVAGTYIAFLSGNISNLCLPCSSASQKAVGAEPGTSKAEVAGVLGITSASITSKIVVIFSIIGGIYILNIIPDSVQSSFTYVLPAIFGAVLGQFAFSTPRYGLLALIIGVLVFFSPIPVFFKVISSVIVTILLIYNIEKYIDRRKGIA